MTSMDSGFRNGGDNYVAPPYASLLHSFGPEVDGRGPEADGRGLEVVSSHQPHESSYAQRDIRPWWKRRRVIFTVVVCIIAIVVAAVVGGVLGSRSSTSQSSPTPTPVPTSEMSGQAEDQLDRSPSVSLLSSLGEETIDLYVVGKNGSAFAKQYINNEWLPGHDTFWVLYGIIVGNLLAVSPARNRTEVFGLGNDGHSLFVLTRPESNNWSASADTDWTYLNRLVTSEPEPVVRNSQRIDIFVIGNSTDDSKMYQNTLHLASEGGNHTIDPPILISPNITDWLNYTPTVVSWSSGENHLFGIRGADRCLYHQKQNPTTDQWSAVVEKIGGYCTSRPAAVSVATGRLDVFVRGGDAQLWQTSYSESNGTTWTDFRLVGNFSTIYEPCAVMVSEDDIAVVVLGREQSVWYANVHRGILPEWTKLGGRFSGPPKAISLGSQQLKVFAIDDQGRLSVQSLVDGKWQDEWEILGAAGQS